MIKGDTCQWRILATHGEKIILNVTQLDIPTSSGCHTDFLEIRDGYWHKSELLGTHLQQTMIVYLIIIQFKRFINDEYEFFLIIKFDYVEVKHLLNQ